MCNWFHQEKCFLFQRYQDWCFFYESSYFKVCDFMPHFVRFIFVIIWILSSLKVNFCEIITLPAPHISESWIKIKINLDFYFEAPQRSVKIKIWVNFFSSSGIEAERVKVWRTFQSSFQKKSGDWTSYRPLRDFKNWNCNKTR